MDSDSERLHRFATDYTAAWCSMNPSAVASHFTDAGSLEINGGTPAVGRDAITAVAASFYEALPDMQVYLRHLVVEGERIEYHWTFTGTNTGPGGTGNSVRVDGFEAWMMGPDGRIAASIGSYDQQEYDRQLAEGI